LAAPVLPVALHPGRRPRQAQPLTAVLVLVLGVAAGRARHELGVPAARR
jgi:hypothetical protein